MQTLLRNLTVLAAALALNGCYYMHLASGEAHVLMRRQRITRVLENPDTPHALKARLKLALHARAFASDHLDLPRNRSYTLYADIGRPFVMYNVFATPALSMKPVQHCFPIAGCVAYQGFYKHARAETAAAKLRKAGNDVYIGGVPAYSTLGHFDDPVLSSMNRWNDDQLVGTIFHELAHQKLYLKGDTAFNESFATFVQREGLRQWHAARHLPPPDPGIAQRRDRFTRLIMDTRKQLTSIYASDRDKATKMHLKHTTFSALRAQYHALAKGGRGGYDSWMAQPLNNARLLPFALYDEQVPAFAALFAQVHRNWPAFFKAARTLSEQPAWQRQVRLQALAQTVPAQTNASDSP